MVRDFYLEDELLTSPAIASLVKDDIFAQNLYAALCNVIWQKQGQSWSCSWRYAGELVADLRKRDEDYLDFYCSGIGCDRIKGYLGEGCVSDSVTTALNELGWELVLIERPL